MKKNRAFLIGVVVLAVIPFLLMTFLSKKTENNESPSIPAPKIDSSILIQDYSPVKGDENAPVTLVEFLDPECEACRAMHPVLNTLMSQYAGKVKLVIRYMPFHGNSRLAASMLEEAREQGKYDEALTILFEKQPEWGDHHHPRPELLPGYLTAIGMKKADLDEKRLITKHGWKIDKDQEDGVKAGVRMTPTFFVNGEMLSEIGYEPLKQAIEKALADLAPEP